MSICPECGFDRPDVIEVPAIDTEPVTEAAVAIAEIEAERDVTLAKIAAKTDESWNESRVAELEGKLRGMQDILDRMMPEPEPEPEPVPVIVEPSAREPVIDDTTIAPPPIAEPVTKSTKGKSVWW